MRSQEGVAGSGGGTTRSRAARRGPDVLVLVVGAVSLLTYYLHGTNGALTRDLGLYTYAGQQFADGVPPYVGVLNRAGPLAHALPGVGVWIARWGGFDELTTMRLLFMGIAVVCTMAVYVLGRAVWESRAAGLVTAATFLSFAGFIRYAADGPREKTPMTLFVVLALWAVTRRRWFTAGVFISLATLCLQIAFFPSFAAAVAGAVILAKGARLRALVRIALGGAVPLGAAVVYFAAVGALRQAADAFLLINMRYTTPDPIYANFGPKVQNVLDVYRLSTWPLVGGLVALVVLAVLLLDRERRAADPAGPVLLAFGIAVFVGVLWNFRDYDGWPDLFPLLPFAALGVTAVVVRLTARASRRTFTRVAAAFSVVAAVVALYLSTTNLTDPLVAQRASVKAVFGLLPADATVTSLEAPQPLVLTGRTNPNRYQMFSGGLETYVADQVPGGLEGFRREVAAGKPTLISVGDTMEDTWRTAFAPDYQYVGEAPGWLWFARSDLGPAKLAQLRRATGATSATPPPAPQ